MRRIKLVISYDGTNYCGWQVQPNGITIQSTLQKAIEDLVCEKIMLTGASRTDSGVHALGQVAVFDTNMQIPDWQFTGAINQRLPRDIVVQESVEVSNEFHPRYCNSVKTYQYKILNRRRALPMERFYSYFVPRTINIEAMKAAAKYICGTHDFHNFCSQRTDVQSTVRTIDSCNIDENNGFILLTITGNGFLYNMVRIIVGALLNVGYGHKKPEHIREMLEENDRKIAGPTAPAHGLTLVEIKYLI